MIDITMIDITMIDILVTILQWSILQWSILQWSILQWSEHLNILLRFACLLMCASAMRGTNTIRKNERTFDNISRTISDSMHHVNLTHSSSFSSPPRGLFRLLSGSPDRPLGQSPLLSVVMWQKNPKLIGKPDTFLWGDPIWILGWPGLRSKSMSD